jgi:hypothetical protein
MEKNINVIIGEKYRQEEPAKTAYNKQYALRALFAPSGFEKPQSLRLVRFSLTHIPAHQKPSVFLIRCAGTSHTLNVIRNTKPKIILKI